MEAVKDCFALACGHARSLIVDADADLVADLRRGNFDEAVGGREADRIVDQIVDRARQPTGLAEDDRACAARAGKGELHAASLPALLPAGDDLADEDAEIDGFEA